MQRHFGTFNERGMTDLRAIVLEWNRGDQSADRAMSAIADLLTDTFGSQVLDESEPRCACCGGPIDRMFGEWTEFSDGRVVCSAGCYEAERS